MTGRKLKECGFCGFHREVPFNLLIRKRNNKVILHANLCQSCVEDIKDWVEKKRTD